MNKQTSSRVSTLAAHMLKSTDREIEMMIESDLQGAVRDIRSLAASCMSQDETPGQVPAHELTFHERLQIERDDLDNRLGKLVDYLNKGAPGATPRHKLMLDEQNRLMSELLAVLDERLCDLTLTAQQSAEATRDGQPIKGDDDPTGS